MIELILGGARSGKSRYAEQQVLHNGRKPGYLATAEALDKEMADRIAEHRARRGAIWNTLEEPLYLGRALQDMDAADTCILVDCLTLWLNNLLLREQSEPGIWRSQRQLLMEVLPGLKADVYLVSNEVGWGIVPLGELSRRFTDEAGWLHQDLGQLCDRATLIVAGMPLTLKS